MAGNPPSSRLVTVRYGQLQSLGAGRPDDAGRAGAQHHRLRGQAARRRRSSAAASRWRFPGTTTLDVEWVGQHSFNTVRTVNINTVDFGAAFLPQNQNPNLVSTTPGGAALSNDLMRSYRG